jgi:glycosyltransferase involved in cell wall biosynthesis
MANLLKKAGQEVHFFSMRGDQNFPCHDERYFISHIDYREAVRKMNPLIAVKVVSSSVYSKEAKRNIARLLNDIKPDIAHLHSIRHHLTKSILPELKKRNIPVSWTLHDYKEICPNTSFYDGKNICEKCFEGKYSNVIWNRCKKGSIGASLITYFEAKINSNPKYEKCVDLYISPSKFLRNKFIEYGYDQKRIIHIPNFIKLDEFNPHYHFEEYILFIGRLEREKGLITLIKGFVKINDGKTFKLKIAGTGSMEEELKSYVRQKKISDIEFVGSKQGKELEDLTKKAKAIIIPSECYENYPYSGLEAMAYGKPIIASRIGGIPEQVEDGVTGFLIEPFNENDLAEKINLLNRLSKEEIEKMGRKAREKAEKDNNSDIYLKRITEIYEELIEKKKQKTA